MAITPHIYEAYLKCLTKCWLRAAGEQAAGNSYAEWVKTQTESYHAAGTKRLLSEAVHGEYAIDPSQEQLKSSKWRLAVNVEIRVPTPCRVQGDQDAHHPAREYWPIFSGDLCPQEALNADRPSHTELKTRQPEKTLSALCPTTLSYDPTTNLQAVEYVPSKGRGKPAQFIPIRFVFTNQVDRDEKLMLAFDALALLEMLGRDVDVGKIIHGDNYDTLKVKTSALAGEVRKDITNIATLLASPAPPDLVLNRHCSECEFQGRCRKIAVEKDDLSLLSSMSEKERKTLRGKGIFTVTQLSYTFRPRRRPEKLRDRREKYHHSLKALAIREKKIHIVGSPELKFEGTPVYLDVEGLPDRDFYYLIGLRIGFGELAVQHTLWADNTIQEKQIWTDFLGILSGIKDPILVHYGSFETVFMKRMCERYGEPPECSVPAIALKSAVNLLSLIYARIYFPTFSNGLKEVAGELGFRWEDSAASGLQSIAWRHQWTTSGEPSIKQSLVTYNTNDCEALGLVASKLTGLHSSYSHGDDTKQAGVVDTTNLKREHPYGFKRNMFVLPELDVINKAAYWDYQRERIYVKSNSQVNRALRRAPNVKKVCPPNKVIECPPPGSCPKCESKKIIKHGSERKTVYDLKFMRHGIKRWITRYEFTRYACKICGATFYPPERPWTRHTFGSESVAYAIYQNIGLRLPQESVDRSMSKLFGFPLALGRTNGFKAKAAKKYEETYHGLITKVCSGHLVHADETKISVKGRDRVVWVFANMEEVAYVYSESRQGDMLHKLLKGFTGVLVSDFYAAYDGIPCPQQKCLIHLIRDLNDDVLKRPYDEELKCLVKGFADLLKPMVETVDRYGLKMRFLKKHLAAVDRFYKHLSKMDFQSESASKIKQRFEKNRDTLFTFLSCDGVRVRATLMPSR